MVCEIFAPESMGIPWEFQDPNVGLSWDYSGIIARYPKMKRFMNPMDPAVPSERKWGV
jgi:hypothetical protein